MVLSIILERKGGKTVNYELISEIVDRSTREEAVLSRLNVDLTEAHFFLGGEGVYFCVIVASYFYK